MAREIVEVKTQVGQTPVRIRVVEFPAAEDIVLQLLAERIFSLKTGESLSTLSPIGRDLKDFLIKTNVTGD